MHRATNSNWVGYLFFGNYFYGICAVALSVEATLQQRLPLNDIYYFIAVFAATVLYYTKAYVVDVNATPIPGNPRSAWYVSNRNAVWWSQVLLTVLLAGWAFYFLYYHWRAVLALSFTQWLLSLAVPVVAALYYGLESGLFARFKLRNIGWLKPFVIGFTWAGLANLYPVIYYNIIHYQPYTFTVIGVLLFIKNFMFVTVLCIMFDIKDYAMDHNHRLKTFVVKVGLRKTIFSIIIPLAAAGVVSLWIYTILLHFSAVRIIINTIPFVAMLAVAYSLHRRQSIFYYLIIIDGLMLLKAACGIVAMLLT